jgi:hypothetical protein
MGGLKGRVEVAEASPEFLKVQDKRNRRLAKAAGKLPAATTVCD